MKKFSSTKLLLAGLVLVAGSLTVGSLHRPVREQLSTLSEVQQTEDKQYVYYDVILDNAKPKKLEVNFKDGKILLSGQLEFQNKVDGFSQGFLSHFEKAIPAPANINPHQYEIEQANGKVTLKFKKSENS